MARRKNYNIHLYMSELYSDIELQTTKTAETLINDSNMDDATMAEIRAKQQVEGSRGDKVIIVRFIGEADAELRLIMGGYLTGGQTDNTDLIIDPRIDLVYNIIMPGRWREATMDILATSAHRFIVDQVIYRWNLLIGKKSMADVYKEAMENAKSLLLQALASRKTTTGTGDADASKDVDVYVYKKDGNLISTTKELLCTCTTHTHTDTQTSPTA